MTRFLRATRTLGTITVVWAMMITGAKASEAQLLTPVFPANATGVELTPSSTPSQQTPSQFPEETGNRRNFHNQSNRDTEILNHYGLVGTFNNDHLSVLLIDGERKVYPLSKRVISQLSLSASAGLPPSQQHLKRGKLVGFETNGRGEITKLVPTEVRRVYDGTVVIVENEKIGLVNYQGERLVTTLSKDKIASLNVVPGKRLQVTQYQGTWATKVCDPTSEHHQQSNHVLTETPRQ